MHEVGNENISHNYCQHNYSNHQIYISLIPKREYSHIQCSKTLQHWTGNPCITNPKTIGNQGLGDPRTGDPIHTKYAIHSRACYFTSAILFQLFFTLRNLSVLIKATRYTQKS